MNKAYLSLGSNEGEREKYLERAIEMMDKNAGKVTIKSSVYETQPWKMKEGAANFLNQVVLLETELTASELMKMILQIEKSMGRDRRSLSVTLYDSRPIDIDILFFNHECIHSQFTIHSSQFTIIIPHPLLHERRFVLVPMNEIAPNFIHPVLHKSMEALLKECEDGSYVKNSSAERGSVSN